MPSNTPSTPYPDDKKAGKPLPEYPLEGDPDDADNDHPIDPNYRPFISTYTGKLVIWAGILTAFGAVSEIDFATLVIVFLIGGLVIKEKMSPS